MARRCCRVSLEACGVAMARATTPEGCAHREIRRSIKTKCRPFQGLYGYPTRIDAQHSTSFCLVENSWFDNGFHPGTQPNAADHGPSISGAARSLSAAWTLQKLESYLPWVAIVCASGSWPLYAVLYRWSTVLLTAWAVIRLDGRCGVILKAEHSDVADRGVMYGVLPCLSPVGIRVSFSSSSSSWNFSFPLMSTSRMWLVVIREIALRLEIQTAARGLKTPKFVVQVAEGIHDSSVVAAHRWGSRFSQGN